MEYPHGKTVDQLIADLQELRKKSGGDALVRINVHGSKDLMLVHSCGVTAVGKTNTYRAVLRGRLPCIILTDW